MTIRLPRDSYDRLATTPLDLRWAARYLASDGRDDLAETGKQLEAEVGSFMARLREHYRDTDLPIR